MAQEMYREARTIKRISEVEPSLDRRYIAGMEGKFSSTSKEAPIEYKAPPKGATPFATQRRSIYFETGSANMSVDSRAVVDEIGNFMRAYENTVVDIEGNTDSTGTREINMELSKQRADAVKDYLTKHGFPAARMRTVGNGPDKPIENNSSPEGREKNRRTDIRVFANPGAK
jgi:outer membrane protein OmpA-like peptidoglycan-associated protein